MNLKNISSWYTEERENNDIYLRSKSKERTLIFLHGMGDSADGWKSNFLDGNSTWADQYTDVILLTAPTCPVTLYEGMMMPSWYNIFEISGNLKKHNYKDAQTNSERINQVISKEIAFFKGDSKRVFIGGFSQGAAMALNIYLSHEKELGGVFALSGYLLPETQIKERENYNIFISHCKDDQLLPLELSKISYERILHLKQIEWITTKSVGHGINHTVSKAAKLFLENKINKN